ncbi:MAG: SpoVG family protein [Bacilli bacterium]|nr:SpoVG family protein [Bacilli bacterium]MBQ9833667.1 SpoVG family protein [Bacilli bacterium]
MNITKVYVRKFEREGSIVKGFASVTIDDAVAINDIRILEGDNGLHIGMPRRKLATGEFKDVAHPVNQEARTQLETAILEKYNEAEDAE